MISWCKGGGQKQLSEQPSEQPSLQHLVVTEKTKTLGGGENNTMRSSISDQCYF